VRATFYCSGCCADISEPLPPDTPSPLTSADLAVLGISVKTAHEVREHADDLLGAL
jgi:hypothetical protein